MSVHGRSALWSMRNRVFIHPPPPPPPAPKTLPVSIPAQAQSNWCWAAVGGGIGGFYDHTSYSQCWIVTTVFKRLDKERGTQIMDNIDCCGPGVDPSVQPCNGESGADQALNTPNLHFDYNTRPLAFADIVSQIDQGRPFAAEVSWAGGGAHFVAITGYTYSAGDPSVPSIYVQDPFYGPSWYMLPLFSSSYQGSGSWVATTLSKP
jgi:hypothetical protein